MKTTQERVLVALLFATALGLQVAQPAYGWSPASSVSKTLTKRMIKPPPAAVAAGRTVVRPAAIRVLPAEVKYSFRNGAYQSRQLTKDTTYYRYHSRSNALPDDRGFVYLTNKPNYSKGAAADVLSLPPGNRPTHVTAYTVPKGTVVDEGVVAPAWGRPGGGHQAVLPSVDPKWARLTTEIAP
jgi:hypothetical protein